MFLPKGVAPTPLLEGNPIRLPSIALGTPGQRSQMSCWTAQIQLGMEWGLDLPSSVSLSPWGNTAVDIKLITLVVAVHAVTWLLWNIATAICDGRRVCLSLKDSHLSFVE